MYNLNPTNIILMMVFNLVGSINGWTLLEANYAGYYLCTGTLSTTDTLHTSSLAAC